MVIRVALLTCALAGLTTVLSAQTAQIDYNSGLNKTNASPQQPARPAPPSTLRAPTRADVLRGEYGRYRANNDLLHYELDVRVDPEKKSIAGKNAIRFRMLKDDTRILNTRGIRAEALGMDFIDASRHAFAQTAEAVVLGVVATPLAAVLAFVDPGLAKDADCAALLAAAGTLDNRLPATAPVH